MLSLLKWMVAYVGSPDPKKSLNIRSVVVPIEHSAPMTQALAERDPVPLKIAAAEEWRLVGAELRRKSPEAFRRIMATLILANTSESDVDDEFKGESYFSA